MDASHILVGGLTAITIAWLLWIEIHSRRNNAAHSQQQNVPAIPSELSPRKKSRGRR